MLRRRYHRGRLVCGSSVASLSPEVEELGKTEREDGRWRGEREAGMSGLGGTVRFSVGGG